MSLFSQNALPFKYVFGNSTINLNIPPINFFKVNNKNNADVARPNQIINQMSKLLTLSKFLQLTSAQIEQLLANCYFMFCVYYIIISGCKLFTIFQGVLMLNSTEPMKVIKIQKLANEPMFSGAFVILTIVFMKARTILVVSWSEKFLTVKKTYGRWKYYSTFHLICNIIKNIKKNGKVVYM